MKRAQVYGIAAYSSEIGYLIVEIRNCTK